MTVTWPEQSARAQSATPAGLRVISLALAALLCAALTYLAVTRQFQIITDLITDSDTITVVIEEPPPPPPPPPTVQHPPQRPVEQYAPTDALAPPTETYDIVSSDPAPPVQAPSVLTNATFLERPSGRDFERYFPRRARERGQSGHVVLDCRVAADGRVDCIVASEEPQGWGFGDASLRAARHFRVAPATRDGRPTSGGTLRVPMTWRVQ